MLSQLQHASTHGQELHKCVHAHTQASLDAPSGIHNVRMNKQFMSCAYTSGHIQERAQDLNSRILHQQRRWGASTQADEQTCVT
jgi:hypothetical protein